MRALCIVVDPPFLDDFLGFTDACEPVLVQAFLAISPVEAFDLGVLGRFAGVDEIKLDAVIISPSIHRVPAQFRSIINDQEIRVSLFKGHAFQHIDHPFSRQRQIHLDGWAFVRAVVFQVGRAKLAAISQRVTVKIERPALIGGNRAPGTLTRYLFAFGAPQDSVAQIG